MIYLGIDVGTGGTRALAHGFAGEGRCLRVGGARELRQPSPRLGGAGSGDWWRACESPCVKRSTSQALAAEEIACIGFSGQMHGAVLLDSRDEVVRPALIWCDQRTEEQCRELGAEYSAAIAHPAHLQSSAHQFHSDKIAVGARERA